MVSWSGSRAGAASRHAVACAFALLFECLGVARGEWKGEALAGERSRKWKGGERQGGGEEVLFLSGRAERLLLGSQAPPE